MLDFYDAFEFGLCNDCDKDPAACEACGTCAYSEATDNDEKTK